jgi:hypothetical protein
VFSDYEGLRKQVEAEGGLHTTTMEVLRELHGAGRLGKHVRDAISGELAAHGVGHLPEELPAYQEMQVRIYRLGTPIADVANAVLHPNAGGDQVLRQMGAAQGQDILKKIRELVCE